MPIKDRHAQHTATNNLDAKGNQAPLDVDLTQLDLDALLRISIADGSPFVLLPATGPDAPADDEDNEDFSDLSLDQLLTLSVSGDQPEEEEEEPEEEDTSEDDEDDQEETAEEETGEDDQGGDEEAQPTSGQGLLPEFQVESVDWLSQDEGFSLRASGNSFYNAGAASSVPPGGLGFGGGSTALGGQPTPASATGGSGNPLDVLFTPLAIGLANGTIGETWLAGDTVGTISATGASASITYSLIDSANNQFAIDSATGDVTILSGPFDFASQPFHTITVQAVDGSETIQQSFTIQVSPGDLDAQGLAGNQVLSGANGNSDDQLYGGAGDDTLSGLNGDDVLHGGSGDDLLIGGNHDDTLFGGSNDDILQGGNHADQLFGGTGSDELYGDGHNDLLFGGGDDDWLHGGDGDDALQGDGGADRLDGGSGSDSLLGGTGDDVLVWDSADLLIDGGDGFDEILVLAGDLDLSAFGGALASIESVNLLSDGKANALSLTAADVLDMTDNGLLTVLGDAKDSVLTQSGWTLAQTDGDGNQLYIQSVGEDVAGLLLNPGMQVVHQDGG